MTFLGINSEEENDDDSDDLQLQSSNKNDNMKAQKQEINKTQLWNNNFATFLSVYIILYLELVLLLFLCNKYFITLKYTFFNNKS